MIKFDNSNDVGILTEGTVELEDELIQYRVEWRLRTEPFLGMKQPTPQGGFLGSECILIIKVPGKKLAGYRFKIFEDGKEKSSGFINDRGESSDLKVCMLYQGAKQYSIEVLEPIPESVPELSVEEI